MTTSRNNGINWRRLRLFAQIVLPLSLWLLFFAAGLLINSEPYRQAIAQPTFKPPHAGLSKAEQSTPSEMPSKTWSWFVVLTCYTPTNVAILCFLAGLLGASGNQVKLGPDSHKTDGSDRTYPLLSALTRGFFVYIVLISGTFVLLPNPFPDPSLTGSNYKYSASDIRELYIRLAGLTSLLSFVVSYKPKLFATAFKKIAGE